MPDNPECQAACRPRMDYVASGSNLASLIEDVAYVTEENTDSASWPTVITLKWLSYIMKEDSGSLISH